MDDCIFCKIIKGEIPCHKVYEDSEFLAFLDISPVKPGHTLVIPKEHFENFSETSNEVLAKMMAVIDKVSKAIIKAADAKGFNLMLNNGKVAGQIIDHTHFHIIPRYDGDGLQLWPGGKYEEGEAEGLLEKIKENL